MKRFLPLLLMGVLSATCLAQTAVQFYRLIPPGYDPASQIPQFVEVSPDLTLPGNRVYVKPPTKNGWSLAQVMAKGVTHWIWGFVGEDGGETALLNDPVYAKKSYNNVPQIRNIFGLSADSNGNWWPNGYYNETQARDKGRQVGIQCRLWIGETMEGEDYVPETNPMWGWFYDELVNRYEAQKAQDGVPYYLAHNYFTRFPDAYQLGFTSRANHEALYNTTWQNWPPTLYHPGQNLGRTNTVLEGIYLNAPDLAVQTLLSTIMRMELMAKMGKFTGLFQFNVHEWHPGFAQKINYPDGVFYRSEKAPIDPNLQIALAFLAQEYGTVFVEWGLGVRASATKKPVDYYPLVHDGKDFWYPTGQSNPSAFPYYSQNGPNRFNTGAYLGDMTHFGIVMWNATGGQVASGTPYYATYRLDGGSWVTRQPNGSDLIASYYEKRGVTRVRIQGNKMMICYFNLFADNERRTIEVQNPLNPAQTFSGSVCGNGIHAVVVNL